MSTLNVECESLERWTGISSLDGWIVRFLPLIHERNGEAIELALYIRVRKDVPLEVAFKSLTVCHGIVVFIMPDEDDSGKRTRYFMLILRRQA